MGILDQITRMKSEGRSEQEIIKNLQQQGIPPRDIQDALSQAQIKNAVFGSENYAGYGSVSEGMQQSIMDQQSEPTYYEDVQGEYTPQPPIDEMPQPANYQPQQYYPQTQGYQQDTYQQSYPQEQYAPESYEGYSGGGGGAYDTYSYQPGTSDTGTLIDIAEQVFAEKTKKMQRQVEELNEFKSLAEGQMKIFEERLKRIEAVIDQLQISILEKIGSYGKNLDSIKKEMSMMQDSFGKVINPFLDRKRKT